MVQGSNRCSLAALGRTCAGGWFWRSVQCADNCSCSRPGRRPHRPAPQHLPPNSNLSDRRLHLRSLGGSPVHRAHNTLTAGAGFMVAVGNRCRKHEIHRRQMHPRQLCWHPFDVGPTAGKELHFLDNVLSLLDFSHPKGELQMLDDVLRAATRHPGQRHHLRHSGAMARLEIQGCRFKSG